MLRLEYKPYTLNFKFIAGTSRGTMKTREVWFLRVGDTSSLGASGIGEVAPLHGLSADPIDEIPRRLRELVSEIAVSQNAHLGCPGLCFGQNTRVSVSCHQDGIGDGLFRFDASGYETMV